MKKLKLTLLFLCAFTLSTLAQPVKILFIGNSYTGVNNLPNLVYNFAFSKGDTLITNSYTPGGYTFQQHSADSNAIAKIYLDQWDFVVLQEQSQLPSFPPAQVAAEVYPYATLLDSMIHDNNPCSETMFYMTWGRKNGDASNCAGWPPVCTYEGMQARLRESYMEMAQQNNSTVAPVGAAFSYVRSLNPTFDLYNPDESHPSIQGSYLAACVFYAAIFHKTPVGSTFLATLSQQDAALLQNAAKTVVLDSISTWYQYGNIPFADFNAASNNLTVQFTNQSLNSSTYSWNFGDGGTSTALNPAHTYPQTGSYVVSLTVSSNCRTDVFTDTIQVGPTYVADPFKDCELFYSYSSGALKSNCGFGLQSIILYDLQGREVRKKEITDVTSTIPFEVADLLPGIYFLKVEGAGFYKTIKMLVP